MADLCRQCTKEVWGEDESDFIFNLKDFDAQDIWLLDHFGILVLCEGCGEVLVDSQGSCIDPTCKLHGINL